MESMTLTPPKQARAIATRNKLLSAAAHCLCELGARGTTTTAVAGSGCVAGSPVQALGANITCWRRYNRASVGDIIHRFSARLRSASIG